eukprot:CAMPEP_0195522852 /NCGR_PEP_ID=MMETSP0794_2-20130614/21413_1 /TAXON_ID=515487 /ORGANISM="Stephanopyxis turris, Strain CCMP 815" /LENGTH=402 /DNA_ID=CAMNT_0040652705 /DNA_START=113 /DNA_END=1321 /DNA_ORIENTATION=+
MTHVVLAPLLLLFLTVSIANVQVCDAFLLPKSTGGNVVINRHQHPYIISRIIETQHASLHEIVRRTRNKSISNRRIVRFSTASVLDESIVAEEANGLMEIGKFRAALTKMGMLAFISSMCVFMPLSLMPGELLRRARIISVTQREILSLRAGQFCARWLMRLIPFANVQVIHEEEGDSGSKGNNVDEPSVWVCNHTSMLDVFFLLASTKRLVKRPMKIVYWKDLEKNPVTKILFKMCGFIPVSMAANKSGEENEYDRSSFKTMLKSVKQAFEDGFDLGILPEGQLNPNPEGGLLPVFSGAFTLSKLSRRPIRMMALNGPHRLWHPDENKGMKVTSRQVKLRMYPNGRIFKSSDEFAETFSTVVGHFGAKGEDLPEEELRQWLDGSKWESMEKNRANMTSGSV